MSAKVPRIGSDSFRGSLSELKIVSTPSMSVEAFVEEKEASPTPPSGETVKDVLWEVITTSTAHALPRVFTKTPIYLKVIWFIFFLASFGVCVYVVTNNFITYFSYGVTTSVSVVSESPTYFPAVTICNLNPFNNKRAQTYIDIVLAANSLTYLKTLSSMGANDSALSLIQNAAELIKNSMASNTSLTSTDRKSFGFYYDEMVISCYFNGDKCSQADFTWFQSYDYGNCYTFNKDSSKKIGASGPGSGLVLELFVGEPTQNENFIYKKGAYVVVHNQSFTPIMSSEGILASVGTETNIAIKRTFLEKKEYPYSSCKSDLSSSTSYNSPLYQAIFTQLNQAAYRQKFCYQYCYQQKVINTIKCYDPSLSNPFPGKTVKPCSTVTEVAQMASVKSDFQKTGIGSQCSSDCPLECSQIMYDSLVSIANYPTTFYSNWLMLQSNVLQKFPNNVTSKALIESSMLKLDIYYNDLTYSSIVESASMTWDSLLGTVGGQLGLFLGFSILTFAELIELLLEVIRVLIKKCKNRQRQVSAK